MDVFPLPTRLAAVATLVSTEGSSPKVVGSKMWVDDTGAVVGAVTIGGCVDARVIEESRGVLAEGVARLHPEDDEVSEDLVGDEEWLSTEQE